MNIENFKLLDEQLSSFENIIEVILNNYPSEDTYSSKNSPLGIITPDMSVESLSQEKLHLLHSMLHLFHSNKSGKGLEEETIINLHSRVKESLSRHEIFDRLDKKE